MTEGSVITFNLCMTKNYYKHLEKHSVLEDMIQNEISRKILIYFPLVLSLAALFIIGHMEPFKNEADIVEKELFNDSSFLISMKAAQAQVGFSFFFNSLKLRIFGNHLKRKTKPLSITANNKNPPIQPIRFEPNMIIYNRVQKCGSRSFLKAVRPIFGCHINI